MSTATQQSLPSGTAGEPSLAEAAALTVALEELIVTLRRLPTDPPLASTAASVLRSVTVEGPQRVSELAARMGISQPGMTQLVARLAADGLVERLRDDADGRAVLVRATPDGARVVRARRSARAQHIRRLLATLSSADRTAIVHAAPALARLAEVTR